MNRTELVLAMSAILFAAFVLGWLLRWAFGRLNQANSVDVAEIDHLATRLHDAEQVLSDTSNALVQKEAELTAAMEGLGMARREASEFHDELEALRASIQKAEVPEPAAEPKPAAEATPDSISEPAAEPEPETEPKPKPAAKKPAKPRAKRAPRKPATTKKPATKE
jgi:outer membrane biosynthesis protein TonB